MTMMRMRAMEKNAISADDSSDDSVRKLGSNIWKIEGNEEFIIHSSISVDVELVIQKLEDRQKNTE
jgi:hypothetical protein